MKKTEYFKLFSHNIPVKGKEKSAIYNLQRSDIKFIPNSLHDVLEKMEYQSIIDLRNEFSQEEQTTFDSYVDFLLSNDFGFITSDIEEYPKMPLDWRTPNTINTAVIEYDFNTSNYDLEDVFTQLDNFLCPHLEIRLKVRNSNDIEIVSKLTEGLVFRSIGLIIAYHESIKENIDNIFNGNEKFEYVVIHNCPEPGLYSEQFKDRVNYITENVYDGLHEKHFPQDNYIVSVKYFSESQEYHTYYNKRVCIDWYGNIKNCLLHQNNFGNINDSLLKDVIADPDFKELWTVHPDRVIDYKEDELRYCKFYTQDLERVDDYYYKVKK